ncbi:Metallo-hydrolase/oxidoreductase [Neurospora crassa]|uniref:Metallo-beta-lactamase domain-containing protein n=1 Tax=Neurospora crassa (strain ATCC 24698 / 74-OR23-1A / CBS 708.71 / DSM 1257 / FGSC 987) TaxID=367110 RepID=Q7S664_NEUCR|nr:metallo-beta-lactamase domain-containing protein [Neurospora crassa OR74A]EAA31036.3 metallo-beta-lactamase domain-containing protein [Neurospora crassa OR74A]KHE86810.1 Metallo-hydrolase/oxidoreductase [Neurospora crassa]|eukprot:XP_960272.3 metallo-beta-lactamase domain-containing protein [Neurospora crassa OR74A]
MTSLQPYLAEVCQTTSSLLTSNTCAPCLYHIRHLTTSFPRSASRIATTRSLSSTSLASTSQKTTVHQFHNRPHLQQLHLIPTNSIQPCLPRRTYTTTTSPPEPTITPLFEPITSTFQYLVADPLTLTAAIIDPVLDYSPLDNSISTTSADALLSLIASNGYKIAWILETHAHADHLSASSYLQTRLTESQGEDHKPPIGIGKRIGTVQTLFSKRYGVPDAEVKEVFGHLFDDDQVFQIGNLKAKAIHLPGHTPDHLGYQIGNNVFCGDSLFNADIGTARCDFPGGSAHDLYHSGRKLLQNLPDETKIWTGHDYPPEDRREPVPCLTVKEHRERNKHLRDGITEEEFVKAREERDRDLAAPRLLHQSLQVNIRAGKLPGENESGLRLLHLPVKIKTDKKW